MASSSAPGAGPKAPQETPAPRMPHTLPGTQCPQGTRPLAGTLPLFKLCGPHSPRRSLQTGFPQWEGDITVSSKLTFPHSDIIFHANRKYQGATLLVMLGSNTHHGPVSGPSPQVLLGRFYALSTQPRACLPASTCTSISAAGMAHKRPSAEWCVSWGPLYAPGLMLKDQVSESNAQLRAAQNKLRTCAQNKGRSGPGVALAWIPHYLLSSTAPLGWGAHPSLLHLSPSYLDQDEAPPHNLFLGLPWACSELNVPPTPPHWTWACSGGPGHLPALSQFLMLSSGPGGTGLGSQHFLPSYSRPMLPGAVGMCRWCRGPCRT